MAVVIRIPYTKFKFIPPNQISLSEYESIKNNFTELILDIKKSGDLIYETNYKTKFLIGNFAAVPSLVSLLLLLVNPIYFESLTILIGIGGLISLFTISSSLSTYSLWSYMRNQKAFFNDMKELVDISENYDVFSQYYEDWKFDPKLFQQLNSFE